MCGADEHVKTLNFSLRYLRRFSQNEIVVVTDLKRTPYPIDNPIVLDVTAPAEFNHHQASIFLKTSLHKVLDMQHQYCYLDSDVIAMRAGVDDIFAQYQAPITFCSDHCRMPAFSPAATHCGCDTQSADNIALLESLQEQEPYQIRPEMVSRPSAQRMRELMSQWESLLQENGEIPVHPQREALMAAVAEWKEHQIADPLVIARRKDLVNRFYEAKKRKLAYPLRVWRDIWPDYRKNLLDGKWRDRDGNVIIDKYTVPLSMFIWNRFKFHLDDGGIWWLDGDGQRVMLHVDRLGALLSLHGFQFDEEKQVWCDPEGQPLTLNYYDAIEQRSEFRFDAVHGVWRDKSGQEIYAPAACQHLREEIEKKFGVRITDERWQHWNGGVFLFDAESIPFLDTWHDWTMEIFKDEAWKTRDQGTLIATVWKHDLQNHPRLPIAFNFIADYHSSRLQFKSGKGFSLDEFETTVDPWFVHVYHHWGDADWEVWKWVESIGVAVPN